MGGSLIRRPPQAAGPSKMCLSPPKLGAGPALPASTQTPATRKSTRDRQSRLPRVSPTGDHELHLIRNHYWVYTQDLIPQDTSASATQIRREQRKFGNGIDGTSMILRPKLSEYRRNARKGTAHPRINRLIDGKHGVEQPQSRKRVYKILELAVGRFPSVCLNKSA